MCGIFATINTQPVTASLLSGLSRLSYRGYDSAGIAVINQGGIFRQRAPGKLENLSQQLALQPLEGFIGIAHTRWATHGLPNERNAHPHMTHDVAVAHNGIVENCNVLRSELEAEGYCFESETDSESIAQLITYFYHQGMGCKVALQKALDQIEGSYAVVVLFKDHPETLFAARKGSPLIIGQADTGYFVSSDENALGDQAKRALHLADGAIACIHTGHLELIDKQGSAITVEFHDIEEITQKTTKQDFAHFMLKEIHEQPDVFRRCWTHYYDMQTGQVKLPNITPPLCHFTRLTIIACGTSYFAGLAAKYWIEQIAGIPVDLDIASEYRYRNAPIDANGAALFISQSGETADTLAAMAYAKQHGQTCIAMVNVVNSTMAHEADWVLPTLAGPEIGVASTKAFMAQITCLLMLALAMARDNQRLSTEDEQSIFKALGTFDQTLKQALSLDNSILDLAHHLNNAKSALFLGRGFATALAEEGALKLKEISYIHAEAYAAGELKHGPLALVDEDMPVFMIAPPDDLFGKNMSNLREVASRGGRIILFSNAKGLAQCRQYIAGGLALPDVHHWLQPMLYVIPLQLLAYHSALLRGNDVDQPRNLAKSVTVE